MLLWCNISLLETDAPPLTRDPSLFAPVRCARLHIYLAKFPRVITRLYPHCAHIGEENNMFVEEVVNRFMIVTERGVRSNSLSKAKVWGSCISSRRRRRCKRQMKTKWTTSERRRVRCAEGWGGGGFWFIGRLIRGRRYIKRDIGWEWYETTTVMTTSKYSILKHIFEIDSHHDVWWNKRERWGGGIDCAASWPC